jgi:hypothetical protein
MADLPGMADGDKEGNNAGTTAVPNGALRRAALEMPFNDDTRKFLEFSFVPQYYCLGDFPVYCFHLEKLTFDKIRFLCLFS